MIHILLAEDEIALAKIIKDSLESLPDFKITLASNGEKAFELFRQIKPDILVLDVMMPQLDGFTLAKMIRQMNKHIPILFLTARSSTEDVVDGFKVGGNDYLKKPFDMEELIVRIQALLNRPIDTKLTKQKEEYRIGAYRFRVAHQLLEINGQTESLSYRETEILRMLCEHQNEVLNRRPVLLALWGDDNFFNARSMDVFITKSIGKSNSSNMVKISLVCPSR